MVNQVILIGNVGGTPERFEGKSGQTICNFSLATLYSYKKSDGEKVKETEWHECTAYGKTAEVILQYVHKGNQLYVEGRIKTQTWEKDGEKRSAKKIMVNEVQFLTPKDGEQTD